MSKTDIDVSCKWAIRFAIYSVVIYFRKGDRKRLSSQFAEVQP